MSKEIEEEVIETKVSKLVGYCCDCELMLSDLNKEGEKYKCNRCGNEMWGEELLDKIELKKWKSKKEYLKGRSNFYGDNFHLNKSTTEYPNSSKNNRDIKKEIIKENDEEDTLD